MTISIMTISITLMSAVTMSGIMLSVHFFCYAEYHNAENPYAECCSANDTEHNAAAANSVPGQTGISLSC